MQAEPPPSVLLTDLYQLTMAAGYLQTGMANRRAVFSLFFRRAPFGGSYAIACGLSRVVEILRTLRFTAEDLDYLRTLKTTLGKPVLPPPFFEWAAAFRLECDVDAAPEGTLVFPSEPLLRVEGPIVQAQILESILLNTLNFETLIATKAARVCQAARGIPVLEFGLRRAQGPDAGLRASRASVVGGCDATSNVLAGARYGVAVRGTHAHSWVMAFEDETDAFRAFGQAMPEDCVFLVDTYDTRRGIDRAIEAARELRARGHELFGVRLDSGDFEVLSRDARRRLDRAGFPEARIVVSGDLDEYRIERLVEAGAPIDLWGVGTRLATAYDQPALDGVYKLTAVERPEGLRGVLKLSDTMEKSTTPGKLQVLRLGGLTSFEADVIIDELRPPGDVFSAVPVATLAREGDRCGDYRSRRAQPAIWDTRRFDKRDFEMRRVLIPVMRGGRIVYDVPGTLDARKRAREQLACLASRHRRFTHPEPYSVWFEEGLFRTKAEMIASLRSPAP